MAAPQRLSAAAQAHAAPPQRAIVWSVFPNGGRNTIRLPGINNFNVALGKRFHFTERMALELRGEAYNALNNPQYVPGFPSSAAPRPRATASANGLTLVNNPLFNRPDLAFQSNARQLQLVAALYVLTNDL